MYVCNTNQPKIICRVADPDPTVKKILIWIRIRPQRKNGSTSDLMKRSRFFMVLILDCNSEKGLDVRDQIGYLIYSRYLIRSSAVRNLMIVLSEKNIFLPYVRNMLWVTIRYKYYDYYFIITLDEFWIMVFRLNPDPINFISAPQP